MIELKDISVTFHQPDRDVYAVRDVDLIIEKGDIYGIVGFSGAGKSTLVRVINLLQRPTTGDVLIKGENITNLKGKDLRRKRQSIGMIFQHFNLMASRTIFDNVDFSLKYSGKSKQERKEKVIELLELVGLSDKHDAYPSQLSGGQKQRVAIARALANDPEILLCDEATSALDPKTTLQILSLLKELNKRLNLTIVLITHEMQVVKEICNKVAVMENGEIVEKGDSVTLFSQAKQELTQTFIRTASHIDQALETILSSQSFIDSSENVWLIELSYIGSQTNEALISQLYSRFQVSANILYGNVEIIQDVPLGSLVVSLTGELDKRKEAIQYLISEGVNITIIQANETIDIEGVSHYARNY
ncbi:methionine ABC transporter ATP-binding protein [Vagococcus luciliae]|uniref:Methionine import ATP-binding protein MetN n=1 Tax=Vagococcus luciliae TaxID=2920380 RepID=A0ABY5NWM6_9ENTE|nr:ATP-binding cassette domain-containing protein [Vagococcus luciliae]UUV98056.1 Methionine import ATP-binding protein MetN [Vagococcus luciliae]